MVDKQRAAGLPRYSLRSGRPAGRTGPDRDRTIISTGDRICPICTQRLRLHHDCLLHRRSRSPLPCLTTTHAQCATAEIPAPRRSLFANTSL
ncbi:hypothetical protein J6590_028657 [Homalodisca vitripennis]|nr:hypothetical protein J6590_028657 [Homalodisca vitripennis]